MAHGSIGDATIMSQFKVEESLDIAEVPSGFPVRFCLLTAGKTQYVAYYDQLRRMTVASRPLDSNKWTYQVLPSKVGWDSHNYITMAMDDDGYLHVSGNMHCVPLIYFRMEKPGDITTLKKLSMTGNTENRCTYPKFMRDADNRLIFHYRDGGSGRGNEIYNVYDLQTRSWNRLLDRSLTDGQGRMNAYMAGPTRGPDGWFHMHWVWRDSPDCASNHHLSYARSKDMLHWESVFGNKIELPISLDKKSLWIDPIPSGGGIINGGHRLFFDADNRPVVTYHKADADGNMQIYAARPEDGEWTIHLLTDWSKPVKFSGRGSMGFIGIGISGLSQAEDGLLTMTYRHRDYGSGRLVIDEKTLLAINKKVSITKQQYPKALNQRQSDFKGMGIQRAKDIGDTGDENVRYILQW
ncbi:MAG: BNR repeat-containing protein, partial [Planctomycetales bacterium]